MKRYFGDRTIDGCIVTVDGRELAARSDLKPGFKGFEWGYEGDAPAHLALALLADHLGDAERAWAMHESFMLGVVANFNNEWEMAGADIDLALSNLSAAAA